MIKTKTLLIFIFLFLFIPIVQSGNIVYINNDKDTYSIYNITEVYIDPSRRLTIKDFTELSKQKLFKQNTAEDLNFGFSNDNVWIKFSIINNTNKIQDIILTIENPDINHISYYEFADGNIKDSLRTGERELFSSRKYLARNYVFELKLETNKLYTYYINANNDGDVLYLPIHIEKTKYFQSYETNQTLLKGFIFGLFLFIILFNIFLFLTINDRIYAYYALYILFLASFSFNVEGYSFQYLWPNHPGITDRLTMMFLALAILFLYKFSRVFLKLKVLAPLVNNTFKFFELVFGITAILSLFDYPILLIPLIVENILSIVTILIILIASIIVIAKKFKPAFYFIGAFLIISSSVVLYVFKNIGFIHQSIFTMNVFNISLVSQSLLLSFAVLDRFRRMSRDSNNKLEQQKRELEIQRDKAQESDRLKSAFLSNMSHEIRTPMNSVVGFASFMTDPDLTEDQRKTFIKLINNNCRVLLRLIDDILDLAKIETGELKITEAECRINNLLDEMYDGFIEERSRLKKDNIDIFLKKDINSDDFVIITDSLRLQQILSNLMQNAIKFTDKGKIEYGYNIKSDKEIEFYVKDTGRGLPEDKIQAIFEKFRKLDYDKSKIYSGIGTGLTISKNLVTLLGGEIFVESELVKGTKVKFTIPLKSLKRIDEYKQSIDSIISNYNWADKNILVVEDEDDNYILLKGILRKTGVKLLWAQNGQKALEIIRSDKLNIDLVLMDLRMPVLDGYDATRRIKELKKNIKIIAVTAMAFANEREESIKAGCDGYISKPINKHKLFEIINLYLSDNKNI